MSGNDPEQTFPDYLKRDLDLVIPSQVVRNSNLVQLVLDGGQIAVFA